MIVRVRRWIALCASLAVLTSCSSTGAKDARPEPHVVDYPALEQATEDKITSGSVSLDNVRVVLVSVDGQTTVRHYRHGFTPEETTHVWSVTKSVVSTLIGIAIADGVIEGLDQPLAELLPRYRSSMSPVVAAVTLRQLMTMSGGFAFQPSEDEVEDAYRRHRDLVALALEQGPAADPGTQFSYSNTSADLVAAVLAAALERGRPGVSVLQYAREKLFDPLGIETEPAFVRPLEDVRAGAFTGAGFGWGTDPRGTPLGGYGLRLRPTDLLELGQLYLNGGAWLGRQLVPAEWVQQVTTPSELQPRYGLMWWLDSWNGHQVYYAAGSEGHLVVVVPDQRAVVAISSRNNQPVPMDDEVLTPLLTEVLMPALDGPR